MSKVQYSFVNRLRTAYFPHLHFIPSDYCILSVFKINYCTLTETVSNRSLLVCDVNFRCIITFKKINYFCLYIDDFDSPLIDRRSTMNNSAEAGNPSIPHKYLQTVYVVDQYLLAHQGQRTLEMLIPTLANIVCLHKFTVKSNSRL